MNWKDQVERENNWMAHHFKFKKPTIRDKAADFLERQRTALEIIVFVLAVVSLFMSIGISAMKIIDHRNIPVEQHDLPMYREVRAEAGYQAQQWIAGERGE